VLALAVLVASATAGAAPHSRTAKPPIILGAAVAQSGGYELYDNTLLAGVRWEMNKINAAGGVDGRMFKLVIADHKTDPSQIGAAADTVLSEGADVVITTPDFDFGAAAALAAAKKQKISISGAGAPEFGKKGLGPYAFNVFQGTPTEVAVMAAFAQQKGWKKPFLLKDTSIAYSKDVCDFYKKTAAGSSIAGEASFKNSDASIASQVGRIRKSGADVVILCSYPPGGASAVRQLRAGGVDTPILGGGAFDGTFWLKSTPNLSNFYYPVMVSSALDDPNPKVNAFIKSVKAPAGTVYALFGYEIVETIATAIKKDGGKLDGPSLAKAIESFKNEPFLVGPTSYSTNCHMPVGRQMAMMQIQNGKPHFMFETKPKKIPPADC
jgi:branched-chain amino acid transport system substrate-binding protein